jgi:superfamily II DNA or RNA helicase
MIEFLAKVDRGLLLREVFRVPLASAVGIDQAAQSPERLAGFLFAYYGTDFFSVVQMRQLFLTLFPLHALNAVASTLRLPTSHYSYDAALILGSLPWTSDSALPDVLQQLSRDHLNASIPPDFLPGSRPDRLPAIEDVVAYRPTPLFDYQRDVANRIVRVLTEPAGRAMVQLPTGAGKTRTAMEAVVRCLVDGREPRRILWLAHSEELCEQAATTFKQSWTTGGAGIGRLCRLWGEHQPEADMVGDGFVVASLQKLVSLSKKKSDLFSRISASCYAVIFDEAHKALAPTYYDLLDRIAAASTSVRIIGLSATPGRSATAPVENKQLAALFTSQLILPDFGGENPIQALRQLGVLARVRRVAIESPFRFRLSDAERKFVDEALDLPTALLSRLSQDAQRNLLIVATLLEQIRHGASAIVFACSVEHSKMMAALSNLNGAPACSITSDMSPASRARCISAFRAGQYRAIMNYGILSTGFDAPNVNTVIIARPTASIVLYSQMIGRAMRGPQVGGNTDATVIDIIDNIEGFGQEERVFGFFAEYWQRSA